jgi:hypothetical protein
MKVWICKWDEGRWALVFGDTKEAAIVALDEVGPATPDDLHELESPGYVLHWAVDRPAKPLNVLSVSESVMRQAEKSEIK